MKAIHVRLSVALILLTVTGSASVATGQQSPRGASHRVRSGATAIVVDAIVVDAKGNPVTGLAKEDFRLLEDGVAQEIGDVTFVGNPSGPANAATARARSEAPRGTSVDAPQAVRRDAPRFVAIVFDRLSGEARALAYKGALACVDGLDADDYAAIYVANLSLETIQDYTNDREKLRAAVKEAATRATARFEDMAVSSGSAGSSHPAVPYVASAESKGRGFESSVAISISTTNSWEMLERNQQGYATTDALLAIASGLGHAPGRKSIVFFAEGLAIPDAVLPRFRDVVATANRSNVSVYTIDSAGLRVHSKDAETGRAVRGMGAAGLVINDDGTSGSSLGMMEYNEDVLRKDPRTSLTVLAEQTGGFLVENTNDLASGVRRIERDRRSYYLLTYVPENSNFDGKWRTIAVKVPNRRVTVRARSGYMAVRVAHAMPLLANEGPALAALERSPLPTDVHVRGGAFVFPEPTESDSRVAVVIATDGGSLAQHTDKTTHGVQTDFTILAQLKDASGEVVRKGSQRYRLAADLRSEVLFFRQPMLPPGTYTLEYVVHDALAQRAGAGTATVNVPVSRTGEPEVSSLMIVRRTERVPTAERDAANPLYDGDMLLYPNLGEPISKRETHEVTFAFSVIFVSAPARMSLTLSNGDHAIGETPLQLGAPDAQGRIWTVSRLPLDTLAPGEYTLTLTVAGGNFSTTRLAPFRVIE